MAFTDGAARVKAVELIAEALRSTSITLRGPTGAATEEEAGKNDAAYLMALYKALSTGLAEEK